MSHYNEAEFLRRVELALEKVKTLLDHTRHPQLPAEVPHRYDDKYLLVEFLTRAAMGGVLTCLESIGLDHEGLAKLREWVKERTVTLRFEAREDCTFLGEKTREIVSPVQRVTEFKGPDGEETSIRDKVVTTVTEYWWNFEFSYRLIAFQGNAPQLGITLCERAGNTGLRTSTERPPRAQNVVRPVLDVDVTWLLQHVDDHSQLAFAIGRHDPRCHTPRRNPPIEQALGAFAKFTEWSSAIGGYFRSELLPVQQEPALSDFDHGALNVKDLFSPVIPLFEGDGQGGPADSVLPMANVNAFLEEQLRCLNVKRQHLSQAFPPNDSVITVHVMHLLVALKHARQVCRDHAAGVDYVEDMLRQQLVAAIGKVLSPVDFAEYMTFHHRKLFKSEYRPQPFSYAIRRPDHDPEGTLSLEVQRSESVPIATLVQRREASQPMSFPLDAATRVSFLGERYLHAWVAHQFSGFSETLTLIARARQFSSYILLLGRISSADTFEPSHAIIVQNKDVLEIPLDLEQIPTPKEFRDAIESLSPEQQRFAKAFRGMQLESTLFGVCVIQIKPQLERLLKLPPDSLTKEIKLTQDLLELFMDYQIPSDLLSFEDSEEVELTSVDKLERVRSYVSRMQELIAEAKQKEVEEAQQREAFRRAESDRTGYVGAGPPPALPRMSLSASIDPFGSGGDPFASGDAFAAGAAGADPFGAPPPAPSAAGGDPFAASPAGGDPFAEAASDPGPAPESPAVEPAPSDPHQPQPESSKEIAAGGGLDYTQIPALLDQRIERLDEDGALRATIISPGDSWQKSYLESLLAEVAHKSLYVNEQRTEKDKAFDLIDALSKSGDLTFQDASLHVVIASTHCFDKTLLETVIQGNMNPVEKVERSSVIVATTIHGLPAHELLLEGQRQRFFTTSPQLKVSADS
ncbi:MAG: hypothetical protein JKY65_22805 [Planctomycetes bacterium]|nr:hypothetical protein [Planctomycetota bacterium]